MPYDDRAKSGGAMLRDLRLRSGLTLLELAGRLDDAGIRIDTAHLQRIESGRIARPTAKTMESILTTGSMRPISSGGTCSMPTVIGSRGNCRPRPKWRTCAAPRQ